MAYRTLDLRYTLLYILIRVLHHTKLQTLFITSSYHCHLACELLTVTNQNYTLYSSYTFGSTIHTAERHSEAKVQKLPYPLDGPSLSKADNSKTEAESNDMAKIPYRAIVGMLSYIMGHTKPDIAYALNVLSQNCNNPGRRHVEFLLCLVKYYEYSKFMLKFHAHLGPYDGETMRSLTQARFQCDADLAGNFDECEYWIYWPQRWKLHKQDLGESVYVYCRIGDQGSLPVLK